MFKIFGRFRRFVNPSSIPPEIGGVYVCSWLKDDPFKNLNELRIVLDVRDGYVKFGIGRGPDDNFFTHFSRPIKEFNETYVRYDNV